jgi:hypothetical protein
MGFIDVLVLAHEVRFSSKSQRQWHADDRGCGGYARIGTNRSALGISAFIRSIRVIRVLFWFSLDILEDIPDVDPHRAGPDAAAAAGAQGLAELVVVVAELVHDPVAVALGLDVAGVVGRGVDGELAEAAGVPAFSATAGLLGPFVIEIEAVAGRAEEGAGAAADAALGDLPPEGTLEVAGEALLDLREVGAARGSGVTVADSLNRAPWAARSCSPLAVRPSAW